MAKRSLFTNLALGASLVGVGLAGFQAVGSEPATSTVSTTAEVTSGNVVLSVSASGNVASDEQLAVNFSAAGKLTEVLVTAGASVSKGQPLARVDDASARSAVDTATANLASAEARLVNRLAGLTVEERRQNDASVGQAATSVQAAEQALENARSTAKLNAAATAEAVRQAEVNRTNAKSLADQNAHNAQTAVAQATATLATDEAKLADLRVAYDETIAARVALDEDKVRCDNGETPLTTDVTCANVASKLTAAQTAETAAKKEYDAQVTKVTTSTNQLETARNNRATVEVQGRQSIDNAENAYVNAVNNRGVTEAKDQQSVATAERSLANAHAAHESAAAGAAVKAAPAKRSDIAADEASIASAKAALETAKRNLADTTLVAPTSGVIASINGKVGETVGASSTSAGSFVVLTNLGSLRVKAGFSEADAAKLKIGQGATLTFDALGTQQFAGRVVGIDVNQTVVQNVVTYYATVELTSPPPSIKPGMTASVNVVVDSRTGVLVLPSTAITGSGSQLTLQKVAKESDVSAEPVATAVTVGLRGDQTVEVLSGLALGDRVAVTAAQAAGPPPGVRPPGVGTGAGLGGR